MLHPGTCPECAVKTDPVLTNTGSLRRKCLVNEAYNQIRDNPVRFFDARRRQLKALGNRVIYCSALRGEKQWVMIWQSKSGVLRTFAVERAGKYWAKMPWHFAKSLRDDCLKDVVFEMLANIHHIFEEFEGMQELSRLVERVVEYIKEGDSPEEAVRAVMPVFKEVSRLWGQTALGRYV
jgi:hypothetical protein